MAYLTAAKKLEIAQTYHSSLPAEAIPYLLTEIAAAVAADHAAPDEAALVADAGALTVADTALAAVTGVSGAGNNAASKADVDTRLATQETFNDAVRVDLAALRTTILAVLTTFRNAGWLATE